MIKLKITGRRAKLLLAILAFTFSLSFNVSAQTGDATLPQRAGYVNDMAGVVDAETKQKLENILANLKQRADIQFVLATVKTTNGRDIFDYSQTLARSWGVVTVTGRKRGLLMLVATEDGKTFTQVSKSLVTELPEGLVANINTRVRAERYGTSLLDAVQTFIFAVAARRGFSTDQMDQPPDTAQANTSAAVSNAQPTPTESAKKETSEPVKQEETQKEAVATKAEETPTPKEEPTAKEEVAKKEETPATTDTAKKELPKVETTTKKETSVPKPKAAAVSEEDLQEEVELTLTLPMAERVEKLKAFIEAHPTSSSITRATELLISAHAALGDEKLRAGDAAAGLEQFRQALAESPANVSDKLFNGVIAQLPLNIFLRGQRDAAIEMARAIETKFKDDPKRLLAIANFYLSIEQPDEAARIAEQAVKAAPDSAAAHRTLGAARHIALRLDEAAAEYARALELDPNFATARRSLADLRRAGGKPEEALSLYREQLKLDPKDIAARAGVVLSLLDLGKRDEANTELDAALKDEPRNLILLVGAAYWFAAHGDSARALELSQTAVRLEPRYTWSYITLARAMIADKHPLDAERAIRTARQYGRFPTLDYELANTLAASGLYDEAAEELARSFTIKDGQIETQLAGRVPMRAESFIELLAPERRASIFQHGAADTEENASILKALLAFNTAINQTSIKESDVVAAAQAFAAGQDKMRAYRQLYAASRLLQHNVALPLVLELTEAAAGGIEAALDAPAATVATLSDELRTLRAQAFAGGVMPVLPDVQSNILSSILRGRVEDITGWTLFNQNKAAEAAIRLRRAASVLPPSTIWLRTALWHLGVALEATGNPQDALNAYIKSYQNGGVQDPVRRAVIEGLYRKINGSLDGLDTKIGEANSISISTNQQPAPSTSAAETAIATNTQATPADTNASTQPTAANTTSTTAPPPAETPTSSPAAPSSTESATPNNQPTSEPPKTEPSKTESVAAPDTASSSAPAKEPAPSTSEPTKDATPAPANNANESEGNYTIQIGSYTDETQAAERAERLRLKGFDAHITKVEIPDRGTWFRVQSGHFQTREEAEEYGKGLKDKGAVLDFIITEINLSTRKRSK